MWDSLLPWPKQEEVIELLLFIYKNLYHVLQIIKKMHTQNKRKQTQKSFFGSSQLLKILIEATAA